MPFACIFVPDFPVEAVLRAEPDLRPKAVALLEGRPPQQKIFAVNTKARAAGIEPGMTRLQAEACPDLVLRCRSAAYEASAHTALLECAKSFSPRVEDTQPETVIFDISGTERLLGSPAQLARKVTARASAFGLEANVAIASNVDAATLAARGFSGVTVIAPGKEEDRLQHLPLEVLFASFPNIDPDGRAELLQTFHRWGIGTLRALNDLPPLALSERMGQRGLRLQELARGAIARTIVPADPPLIFEENVELEYPVVLLEPLAFLLERMLNQVCSRLSSRALATQELHLKLDLETGVHLDDEEDFTLEEQLFGVASRPAKESNDVATSVLASRASNRATRYQIANSTDDGARLTHQARSDDDAHPMLDFASTPNASSSTAEEPRFSTASAAINNPGLQPRRNSTFTRTLRLPVPMLDAKIFLKLFQLDLKAHPPGAPIKQITLTAEPARARPGQAGLFLPPTPEPEKLELTLARISGIVGEHNVGSLELLDTHSPNGFRMQHFNPFVSEIKKSRDNGHSRPEILSSDALTSSSITALRLFRPPIQASVTLRDGKPAHIVCQKNTAPIGEVIWQAGPWRSSGDWWEKDAWARDEWDIALQTSHAVVLYRLVRDLLAGKWFLEGTYD
jgi:nucleotidyltransferase/DNA polymerase involved in DNA repair